MRNFMIRAFEAVILAFSLLAALGVTLAAAGMVMGQVTLAELDGPLSMLGVGTELQAQRMAAEIAGEPLPDAVQDSALAVWLSAGAVLLAGYLSIILLSGAALTLTGIYRRMTRLVKLIEATPTE
ncbi:hypothetical protein KUV28_13920 [Ferrimonas balearica]|nr:hypothetical protein [Ferrimonas balearica]